MSGTGDERDILNTKKHRGLWGAVEMFPTMVTVTVIRWYANYTYINITLKITYALLPWVIRVI